MAPARPMVRVVLEASCDPAAIDWRAGAAQIARMTYDDVYPPETFDIDDPHADLAAFMREVRAVVIDDWRWLEQCVISGELPADARLVQPETGFRIEAARPVRGTRRWSYDRLCAIPDRAYRAAGFVRLPGE